MMDATHFSVELDSLECDLIYIETYLSLCELDEEHLCTIRVKIEKMRTHINGLQQCITNQNEWDAGEDL